MNFIIETRCTPNKKKMSKISNILLKDKSDLIGVEEFIPNAYILGAMEKPNLPSEDIKVLSTKFSKVGRTTLERFPNLEWVVYRGHGTDSINLDMCSQYGVGVVSTNPNIEGCSHWIKDKLKDGKTIIFGNGSISKRLQQMISDYHVVDSKTKIIHIDDEFKNVVSCVSLNQSTEDMFNYKLFKNMSDVNFVSISRAKTHNNKDLIKLIEENKLSSIFIDTLGTDVRDELLSTNKVTYTKHMSWDYLGHKNDHKKLSEIIQSCLDGNVKNPILNRRENQWF